jgi:hypothetical protein
VLHILIRVWYSRVVEVFPLNSNFILFLSHDLFQILLPFSIAVFFSFCVSFVASYLQTTLATLISRSRPTSWLLQAQYVNWIFWFLFVLLPLVGTQSIFFPFWPHPMAQPFSWTAINWTLFGFLNAPILLGYQFNLQYYVHRTLYREKKQVPF